MVRGHASAIASKFRRSPDTRRRRGSPAGKCETRTTYQASSSRLRRLNPGRHPRVVFSVETEDRSLNRGDDGFIWRAAVVHDGGSRAGTSPAKRKLFEPPAQKPILAVFPFARASLSAPRRFIAASVVCTVGATTGSSSP